MTFAAQQQNCTEFAAPQPSALERAQALLLLRHRLLGGRLLRAGLRLWGGSRLQFLLVEEGLCGCPGISESILIWDVVSGFGVTGFTLKYLYIEVVGLPSRPGL